MTVIDHAFLAPFAAVTVDLYRDIHKGIRAELFDLAGSAGRFDSSDRGARTTLAGHVDRVMDVLVLHAEHEDSVVLPDIMVHLPELGERIETEHETLEARMVLLRELAGVAVETTSSQTRHTAHCLYIELASFTSAYLAHQDLEERLVMPALEAAIGVDAVLAHHQAIVGSIPPPLMAQSLAFMLPAMNIDDRVEMLGGMREAAPAEVFAGVWGLAQSVLAPGDHAALAARLGIGDMITS